MPPLLNPPGNSLPPSDVPQGLPSSPIMSPPSGPTGGKVNIAALRPIVNELLNGVQNGSIDEKVIINIISSIPPDVLQEITSKLDQGRFGQNLKDLQPTLEEAANSGVGGRGFNINFFDPSQESALVKEFGRENLAKPIEKMLDRMFPPEEEV